jgi:succinyl-CoA synthetase alpha subunit
LSVLINKDTRVLVQGITGREGGFQAARSQEYFGTKIVAGCTPGRGGETALGVPVYNTVAEAVAGSGPIDCTIIYVPAPGAADAVLEAANSNIKVIICITEGVPTIDMMTVKRALKGRTDITLIGPNCPGVITPEECRVGIMPGSVFKKGHVGVVSRSGTLVYEAVDQLTRQGIGQSTCVGVGGDPIIGTTTRQVLEMFNNDPETHAIVMIGEIGGTAEQEAAAYIKANVKKPVVAFIAGSTAPAGRRMGHAGAIIAGNTGTAAAKKAALTDAGAVISESPADIGVTMARVLKERGLA